MPMTPTEIENYVDAAAAALNLPLSPEHRPGVLHYFALASGLADLVAAHPLGVTDDPAESFEPISLSRDAVNKRLT
ncbi:MAG: DUF4089 domain-containing protein [Pseudorhodobacter sp.]|nr:DUF4089 domain-containing protein [Rhizobacter sp.]